MYDSVKAINIPVPKLIKFVSEILINKMTQNSLVHLAHLHAGSKFRA